MTEIPRARKTEAIDWSPLAQPPSPVSRTASRSLPRLVGSSSRGRPTTSLGGRELGGRGPKETSTAGIARAQSRDEFTSPTREWPTGSGRPHLSLRLRRFDDLQRGSRLGPARNPAASKVIYSRSIRERRGAPFPGACASRGAPEGRLDGEPR